MSKKTRGWIFVALAVGVAILFAAVRRRERPRRMRVNDPLPSDFVEIFPPAANGHANGVRHEAIEEL